MAPPLPTDRPDRSAIGYSLAAAALFGASTPLAKYLLGAINPWMLAGLLYLGSGVGLTVLRWLKPGTTARLTRAELSWLFGAILSGGVVAPVLLMYGLTHLPSSVAALLLNAEGVLTALLAWIAFREHFNGRVAIGMGFICLGALLLSWPTGSGPGALIPSLTVVAACFAWAVDNNLTRKIALADATRIAGLKGLVAGAVNLSLAFLLGNSLPPVTSSLLAMGTGLFTYGVSLVLFVLALRGLGAARTAAYFSLAPFVGALIGILSGDPVTWHLAAAFALMATGIWLHLTEAHSHEHVHESIEHDHTHVHDEHHQHAHDEALVTDSPHKHRHRHTRLHHTHVHFPDSHHDHPH
ncbi:MAG: EamA family transporter [Steroidobacteraceae bacterium]